MTSPMLLYAASFLVILWGITHMCGTHGVVRRFGVLSADHQHILTMEWIVEGLALITLGLFVAAGPAIDSSSPVADGVCAIAALLLIALAIRSLFTGFRLRFLPFRRCLLMFGVAAASIVWGGLRQAANARGRLAAALVAQRAGACHGCIALPWGACCTDLVGGAQ